MLSAISEEQARRVAREVRRALVSLGATAGTVRVLAHT